MGTFVATNISTSNYCCLAHFSFLFFSAVIYLVLGELGLEMLSSSIPNFVMTLPLREGTSNGEWLSAKPAPVKRKKVTSAKTMSITPSKKIKTATKVTAKANEIIELSSLSSDDDDDTEPDVPLVSLRQVDEPYEDEVWNDSDSDSSDEEYKCVGLIY
jgi:hypothetical protein